MVKTKEDLPFWDKYVEIKENPEYFGIPQVHIDRLQQLKADGFHPQVVYDIGSAVGHWKVAMEQVWPEARTLLFEANEDMAPFYDHYGWEDYHIGLLSDADDTKRNYYYNEEYIGGNSYYRENTPAYSSETFRVLNTETLDKVVADKGWPHPQLMKLDVQGAECDILKGSTQVLESVEWLIVELQHINYNDGALLAADSIALIQSLGFELIHERFASSDATIDADYLFRKKP
jgi:FkbM family methyltransferase